MNVENDQPCPTVCMFLWMSTSSKVRWRVGERWRLTRSCCGLLSRKLYKPGGVAYTIPLGSSPITSNSPIHSSLMYMLFITLHDITQYFEQFILHFYSFPIRLTIKYSFRDQYCFFPRWMPLKEKIRVLEFFFPFQSENRFNLVFSRCK